MRILCLFREAQKVWETSDTEVIFGRAEGRRPIILDLSPDQRVSRTHGRIWEEEGRCWIEDLNSAGGTKVNGVEIKGRGIQQLRPSDSIVVGETTLRVEAGESRSTPRRTSYLENGTILLPE